MSKRTIVIIVVVAVAAVVLGAVLIAMPKKTVSPAGVNVGGSASATTAGSTSASETSSASSSTASTTTGTSGTSNSGDTGEGSGLAGVKTSKNSTLTASSTTKPTEASVDIVWGRSPFKTIDLSQVKTTADLSPKAAGVSLLKLTTVQGDHVVSGLDLKISKMPRMAQYAVTFRPIGYGPGYQASSATLADRVLITVDSATQRGSVPKDTVLANPQYQWSASNSPAGILCIMDVADNGKLTTGGTYKGIIAWEYDGTQLYPVLRNIQ